MSKESIGEILESLPILYLSVDETTNSQTAIYVPKDAPTPEGYTYSVGVTLDYLPEDQVWAASYSDFIETHDATIEGALLSLRDIVKSEIIK